MYELNHGLSCDRQAKQDLAGMKRFIEESNTFSHSETAAVGLGAEKTVDQSADSRKRLRPAKSAHFQFQVWWEAVRGR